jgi:5-methylcytosine-specific restriction endonuclease McrBC GTP-binding regulatory subunit McrB
MALHRNEQGEFFVGVDQGKIYDFFKDRGFTFPPETITCYLLSLATKPFVILTGISGTGKTKIAQVFADFILQNETTTTKHNRKRFIPVRPDWMDNRGLLGFFNLLDERYHATPLLELLLQANGEEDQKDPFFVIMDEMNLARVEQYFSDFLSIMESRTPDNVGGERLRLHSFAEGKTTVGNLSVPPDITIPMNVFFTGTVNVDESTYMFSPKVLDRANVIEFNDVRLDFDEDSGSRGQFELRSDKQHIEEIVGLLQSSCIPSRRDYEEAKTKNGNYKVTLQNLMDLLREYNLHFGYRVINEMSRFLLIAQECVENYSFEETFDIQLLQKVLPKYHGTQGKLKKPLEGFLAFCYPGQVQYEDSLLSRATGFDRSARFPRSAKKIARMLENLNTQGYCSFIE